MSSVGFIYGLMAIAVISAMRDAKCGFWRSFGAALLWPLTAMEMLLERVVQDEKKWRESTKTDGEIIICHGCHYSFDVSETTAVYCKQCLRMAKHLGVTIDHDPIFGAGQTMKKVQP